MDPVSIENCATSYTGIKMTSKKNSSPKNAAKSKECVLWRPTLRGGDTKSKPVVATSNGSEKEYKQWRDVFNKGKEFFNEETRDWQNSFVNNRAINAIKKEMEYQKRIDRVLSETNFKIKNILNSSNQPPTKEEESREYTEGESMKVIQDALDIFGRTPVYDNDDLGDLSEDKTLPLSNKEFDDSDEDKKENLIEAQDKEIGELKKQLEFLKDKTPEEILMLKKVALTPTPNNNKISAKTGRKSFDVVVGPKRIEKIKAIGKTLIEEKHVSVDELFWQKDIAFIIAEAYGKDSPRYLGRCPISDNGVLVKIDRKEISLQYSKEYGLHPKTAKAKVKALF
jgi:hypothetical protein